MVTLPPYGLNNENQAHCGAGHFSPGTILSKKRQKKR
jgi:hypothetical protein